jgi:hypothetical protein
VFSGLVQAVALLENYKSKDDPATLSPNVKQVRGILTISKHPGFPKIIFFLLKNNERRGSYSKDDSLSPNVKQVRGIF